jgi:transposase InsO family protein
MVGPLKIAPGRFNHIFVAIDKFTKWIEVKPLVKTTRAKVAKFFDDIIHRFGIPYRIITDLGSNFTGSEFFDFCKDHEIKVCYVSMAHPRANGQVECANEMIL